MLGSCLAYGVAALVRRRRAGSEHRPPTRAAGLLAASAALAVVLSAATLVGLMASSSSAGVGTGPLIAGRPIGWLAAQIAGVATVASTFVLLARWRSLPRLERILAGAGILFVPFAAYWGVLLP